MKKITLLTANKQKYNIYLDSDLQPIENKRNDSYLTEKNIELNFISVWCTPKGKDIKKYGKELESIEFQFNLDFIPNTVLFWGNENIIDYERFIKE